MKARAGNRIVLESERVGQVDRTGEILEVHESPYGPEYRVRWDDGRITEFRPKAGSARILGAEPAAKR
jgi:hypothetical protein